MKRRSKQNIVIGGAAGAVPVLVGWAAVTNSLSWTPVLLFLVIFIWTPPHFWALAVRYRDDYEAAHVPDDAGRGFTATTRPSRYSSTPSCLWALTLLIGPTAHLGWVYAISATVLGRDSSRSTRCVCTVTRRDDRADVAEAMRLFHFSITYLSALFILMAVDVLVRHH